MHETVKGQRIVGKGAHMCNQVPVLLQQLLWDAHWDCNTSFLT